ncbi:hypothetical protein Hanom_Chr09g00793541 [Helianthus anomalus]
MMERSDKSDFCFNDGHGSNALVVERKTTKKKAKMVESMTLGGFVHDNIHSTLYIADHYTCELTIIPMYLLFVFLSSLFFG